MKRNKTGARVFVGGRSCRRNEMEATAPNCAAASASCENINARQRAGVRRLVAGLLRIVAGLLFDSKLQLIYVLSLIPMLLGLHTGNKVHLDITSEGMLKVVGALLVVSGAMLFIKVIF